MHLWWFNIYTNLKSQLRIFKADHKLKKNILIGAWPLTIFAEYTLNLQKNYSILSNMQTAFAASLST